MNKDDNRCSITAVRSGVSAGAEGPRFFLAAAEEIKYKTLNANFSKKHNAPPGSKVIATPNAYMTNDAWNLISEDFAKGLRQLPVVRDYPELWMVMTLDGFGSHLEGDALKVFAKHKILIVKEEGDSLQVCQPYDKKVALADKRHHRSLLTGIHVHMMIDQWALILVANTVRAFCNNTVALLVVTKISFIPF